MESSNPTTTPGGTMLDELDNDTLSSMPERFWINHDPVTELARVEHVITKNVLTGADLGYWFERRRILRERLGES